MSVRSLRPVRPLRHVADAPRHLPRLAGEDRASAFFILPCDAGEGDRFSGGGGGSSTALHPYSHARLHACGGSI